MLMQELFWYNKKIRETNFLKMGSAKKFEDSSIYNDLLQL
jgi:hypothetical protein